MSIYDRNWFLTVDERNFKVSLCVQVTSKFNFAFYIILLRLVTFSSLISSDCLQSNRSQSAHHRKSEPNLTRCQSDGIKIPFLWDLTCNDTYRDKPLFWEKNCFIACWLLWRKKIEIMKTTNERRRESLAGNVPLDLERIINILNRWWLWNWAKKIKRW